MESGSAVLLRSGVAPVMPPRRPLPAAVRRWLEFFAGKECQACSRAIDGVQLRRHWDHVCARRGGGEDVAFNLQQLCHQCNLKKWAHLTPQVRAMLLQEERRAIEIADYFHSGAARILGNAALREPQRQAYLALRAHFGRERNAVPAILQIPTGCGKSGILAIAPYGIANGRVLVVAPNLTIKRGLERQLSGAFFLQWGVFARATQLPRVVVLGPHANREDCLRAEVVIANVQQIQSWLSLFPSAFFDMVLVDEGHHTPASSWQRIIEAFPDAKKAYLTATPFRGDGRPLYGERIYQFSLKDAMKHGFVKHVVKVDAVPARVTFHAEGETRDYSTEEVLAMRDEAWFSRGIALSEACNRSIVEKSFQILIDRRRGGYPHQIIAVACSIPHARQVVGLYRARGARATIVHSKMEWTERAARMDQFERGAFDVIVHVGLLGEGYDHPPLSIAAIFRPFRTLPPYAQFIGRTLRRLPGAPERENVAHVVSHVGLNLEPLWRDFKREVCETGDAEDVADESARETPEREREEDESFEREETPPPEAIREEIARYEIDTFLPADDAERDLLERELSRLVTPDTEGSTLPDLQPLLAAQRARGADGPVAFPMKRPDLERHEFRQLLAVAARKAAGRVLGEIGLGAGTELVPIAGKGEERSNYEVVVRLLNRQLNRAAGKPETGSDRLSWSIEECRAALRLVEGAADAAREDLRRGLARGAPAAKEGTSKTDGETSL